MGEGNIHIESVCAAEPKVNKTTEAHKNPIYASSTFRFNTIEEGISIFKDQPGGHVYTRYGNPGIEAVAAKIAELEVFGSPESAYGLLTSSGMAAIYTAVRCVLHSGDLLVTQQNLYGGTTELFEKILPSENIQCVALDLGDEDALDQVLSQHTRCNKAIFLETPANPSLQCLNIESISGLAKSYGAMVIVDNTFATPVLQRPLLLGADLVAHSTTKYLHGHGLSTGGAVIGRDEDLMRNKAWPFMKLTGCNSNPFDAWLLNTGLKTLALRIVRQSENAHYIAKRLQEMKGVNRVLYPGLTDFATHAVAAKQMSHFGAMLSFETGESLADAKLFCNKLRHCTIAPSLGETDTMVLHPATMSHLKVDPSIRKYYGITDNLVRMSVGLEHPDDILADIEQALVA
ncbi:MAG: aminotransferase class I/II-fold pyridoxal phosphate-dependent enzyme [Saprospiraceae bacterium]|nr:aminotransferase class I/II-fold pyridoxal phosphate-dependent enzyme [Saprospiraceae bacterium]